MQVLGPLLGMALLGVVAGWLLGGLCRKAMRFAVLAVVVFIAIELLGYHIATGHWETIASGAGAAARSAGEVAQSSRHTLLRIVTYNVPFTVGFLWGLSRALPRRRK